jgi:hypothetical protein
MSGSEAMLDGTPLPPVDCTEGGGGSGLSVFNRDLGTAAGRTAAEEVGGGGVGGDSGETVGG